MTDATDRASFEEALLEHAPAAYIDEYSAAVLDEAIGSLGTLRRVQWVGDAGAVLHVLASLAAHVEAILPDAIRDARDQDYSWSEIAAVLGVSRDRAKRLTAQPTGPRLITISDERGLPIDD